MTETTAVARLREEFELTPKQARFVVEFVAAECNAAEAARRAGYSESCAKEIGHENLTKPHIQRALASYCGPLLRRSEVTAERVLQEYARVAFIRLDDVATWDEEGRVRVKPSAELEPDALAALRCLEFRETTTRTKQGDEIERRRLKVKLHDKLKALDVLAEVTELVEAEKPTAGPVVVVAPLAFGFLKKAPDPTGQEVEILPSRQETSV